MKAVVKRSELHGVKNFDAIVRKHASDMLEYAEHRKNVAKGIADPYPAPHAPEVVTRCIDDQNFGVDYRIEEDVPEPPTPLRTAQDDALAAISRIEVAIAHSILPPGKHRIAMSERATPEQKAAVRKIQEINLHAAEMMAAVEDWTEPTKLSDDEIKERFAS